jgi:tetratricopeptide (TPR) repeat protein
MGLKVGRNDACPCGSGQKYKRCCLPAHEAGRAAKLSASPVVPETWAVEDDLDELSNRANDLIRAGRLAEAEDACRLLAEEYPDQIDQYDRLAQLREAQGQYAEAAALYRKAASWAETAEGFEDAAVDGYLEDAARCEQRTR